MTLQHPPGSLVAKSGEVLGVLTYLCFLLWHRLLLIILHLLIFPLHNSLYISVSL